MNASDHMRATLERFAAEYASKPNGQAHLGVYEPQRIAGRANFADVLARSEAGEDVTLLVLTKLLPHMDTPHNRGRGAWVHIAPAITRDVQTWFTRARWVKPDQWPAVTDAILEFYSRAYASPDDIASICKEYGADEHSKGIQTAFLSPMLNALFPERFCIVNSKSRKTARAFSARRYPLDIARYPETNDRLLELIEASGEVLAPFVSDAVRAADVFDAFCHWFVAIDKGATVAGSREADPDRADPDVVEAWLGRTVPADARGVVERLLSEAVSTAYQHGGSCWSVTWKRRRIRLNVGRLAAMTITAKALAIGFLRERESELTTALPQGSFDVSEPFGAEPAAATCSIALDAVRDNEAALRNSLLAFIPVAAGTAARTPYGRSHSPGVIEYLAQRTGSSLEQPDFSEVAPRRRSPAAPIQPAVAVRQPRTLFKKVDYELSNLLSYIALGDIALPDLQRPFVWHQTKVRDLFDSMYRGYPVGYLLFWSNAAMRRARPVGQDSKQHIPSLLIVDGQQRLTSLFSVFRGVPVLDEDFNEVNLDIAFRPRDGTFEVPDAAIRRNPEYIASISDLWRDGSSAWAITNRFFQQLESVRPLSDEDKEAMSHNINRLMDLHKYPFTALEISSEVDEQSVADVFVRINSEGVKLNQADFILTLLSVIWPEGRKQLEKFAHDAKKPESTLRGPSPFNHLIKVGPDQMLRVSIAVGFYRARLRAVYQLLRAKDLDGTETAFDKREEQLVRLRTAQAAALDLRNWHGFLHAIAVAGYKSADLISSDTALIYSYALYLIGRLQCRVPEHRLDRLIARWFVANLITGRYSGSSETIMEEDLTAVRELESEQQFAEFIESRLDSIVTNDFWEMTLPLELETSSQRSPVALAFLAAQVRLNAPVLFSDKPIAQLLDPSIRPQRVSVDMHHLFPRAHLAKLGIRRTKDVNQAANFSLVEWPENITIGSRPPSQYVPAIRTRFSDTSWDRMSRGHALPPNWETLGYDEFLRARRVLMAAMIHRSFDSLLEARNDGPETNATATELHIWEQIKSAELTLRRVIRKKYEDQFGEQADDRMRSVLGINASETIDKIRMKRQRHLPDGVVPPDDLLDYTYLGQLIQLMISGEAWQAFKPAFRDKRELEDLARAITLVRNEAAHFRHVPEQDLMRCKVAVDDLLQLIAKLGDF